jgi:triosephosphate isomerase
VNAQRRPLVAGNWKMHLGPAAAAEFARDLRQRLPDLPDREIAIFPPAISIPAVAGALAGSQVAWGGQDCHWEERGAFTGETSPSFLAAAGCRYVLVGHSERRSLFGETDAACGRKLVAAVRNGLRPVLCCGETLAQRDAGAVAATVETQLAGALAGAGELRFDVAYEPVWAIGTGRTATTEQAREVHQLIRAWLTRSLGPATAATRILYGGSVRPDNVDALISVPEIDGVLVGGASLDAAAFERIARFRAGQAG